MTTEILVVSRPVEIEVQKREVTLELAGTRGDQGFKGDPGGNTMATGLATQVIGQTIPVGTDLIQTSGFSAVGKGAARYALSADQASAAGTGRLKSLNNRYFDLVEDEPTFAMLGVVADGSTDDSATFRNALTWAKAKGRGLFHSGGVINITTWATTFALDFYFKITSLALPGAASIKGPAKGTGDLFSLTANGSFENVGVKILNWRRQISLAATFSTDGVIKLTESDHTDSTSVIWGGDASSSGGLTVYLEGVVFRRNYVDCDVYQVNINGLWAVRVDAADGGPESLNFSPIGGKTGKDYFISDSRWKNYTNDRSGSDADGHFIRAYGTSAKIINCDFDGLYATGASGIDTEGLRMATDDLQVSNCRFRNAGLQEGVIVNKGGARSKVSDCIIEVTAGYLTYNATHIATGSKLFTLSLASNISYANCDFIGFNKPSEFTGGGSAGYCSMTDCNFVNCTGDRLIHAISDTSVKLTLDGCKVISTDGTAAGLCTYLFYGQNCGQDTEVIFKGCDLAFITGAFYTPSNGNRFSVHFEGGSAWSTNVTLGGPGLLVLGGAGECTKLFLRGVEVKSENLGISRGAANAGFSIRDWDIEYDFYLKSAGAGILDAIYISVPTGAACHASMEYATSSPSVAGSYASFRGVIDTQNNAGTLGVVAGGPADVNVKSTAASAWGSGQLTVNNTTLSRLRARVGASTADATTTIQFKGRSKIAA